jgi:hypothetical protein
VHLKLAASLRHEAGLEVLTAEGIKHLVFWDIMLCTTVTVLELSEVYIASISTVKD